MVVLSACALIFLQLTTAIGHDGPGDCTFNPLFLEGTCSAHYEDPAALLIDNLFLSIAEADCDLASPCSYPPHYSPRNLEEFDFIIVGAGSAGSILANRLSEIAGWKVLLLEAGGNPSKTSEVPRLFNQLKLTEEDWQFYTDSEEPNCLGFEGNQCRWPRGRVLGGSSTINGMFFVRGNPKDFDGWESEGNYGWGYRDVLPYFKKYEDMRPPEVQRTPDFQFFHSIGGPLKIEDYNFENAEVLGELLGAGFAKLGYLYNPDYNGKVQSGFCRKRGTFEDGRRCSTAKAFLSPIRFRDNIKVSKHSLVTKILIDDLKRHAYGVEFIDRKNNTVKVVARKEVIISAGSINSPHLLMLSGIGPRNHLSEFGIHTIADLPVGKNLQDHGLTLGLILTLDYSYPPRDQIKDMLDLLLDYDNGFTNFGVDSFHIFVDTERCIIDYPNTQIYFVSFNKNDTGLFGYLNILGVRSEIQDQIIELNSHSFILMLQPAVINPFSRGRISLQSRDPLQYPKLRSGYFNDDRDVDSFMKAIDFIRDFANTEPLRAAGAKLHEIEIDICTKYPFDSIPYRDCFLRYLTTSIHHQVGTCRMGPTGNDDTVVDPELRVHGVGSLRVIDASVMPTIVRGNTNAATMMIAEKAADIIKRTWLGSHDGCADGYTRG